MVLPGQIRQEDASKRQQLGKGRPKILPGCIGPPPRDKSAMQELGRIRASVVADAPLVGCEEIVS